LLFLDAVVSTSEVVSLSAWPTNAMALLQAENRQWRSVKDFNYIPCLLQNSREFYRSEIEARRDGLRIWLGKAGCMEAPAELVSF